MSGDLIKRAGEARCVAIQWRELEAGETLVEDLGWLIVPQELDVRALVLAGAAMGTASSSAVLRGGRPGHVYHVAHRVRTSAGRVLSRGLLLRVAAD